MATGGFSDYQINEWLAQVRTGYLALHYDNPDIAGAYASEVFGGSYSRQQYTMTQPTNKGMLLLNPVIFTGLPSVLVIYVAGWDNVNGGNYRWSAPLPTPHTVLEGKTISIPAQTIGISLA